METVNRTDCKKCLMSFEERFVNEDGECVICHEHRKKWLNKDYVQSEKELVRIFDHYKVRNKDKKYDAIVAFSGGKDSVYALYLARKKYGLRPLAVTGDNGILTERSRKNMKIVVDKLEVDHLIVSQDKKELQSLYRAFFQKTKNFCEICYLTILKSLGEAAVEYDVPLMITGFAFKIDSSHFRARQRYCLEDAFAHIVKDAVPAQVYQKYMTKSVRAEKHLHMLHLFDYVNHVEKDIYELLETELGWDSNNKNDKHSDCRFHDMLSYLKWINNDLTSLALMTPAALLRDGQISRRGFDDMLAKQEETFQQVDRKQVEDFLEYFDVDEGFLTKKLDDPSLVEPLALEEDFKPLLLARQENGKSQRELIEMLIDIIRPEIKRDGGDIKILEFNDNCLKIKLLGGCRGCLIADQVMIRYLEYLVRKNISNNIVIENVKELVP